MKLSDFEAVDWDDEENEDGNLVHCLRHGVTERVVYEVLREAPVEIDLVVRSADFAVVGPDSNGRMWTLLFDVSPRHGDWLRPVTGWQAEVDEIAEWTRARKRE